MVKWWNTVADISLSKNGKMEKRLYSILSDISFTPPSNDEYQAGFLTPSAAASAVSGRCGVASLIVPQAVPMPLDSVPPWWFLSIHLLFTFLQTPPIPGGGVPFCYLLILTIARFFYTCDKLYFLSTTVTYTNFTSAVWSPHEHFAKVYL